MPPNALSSYSAWQKKLRRSAGYFFVVAFAFLADRISKAWAAAYLSEYGATTFSPLFTLRETYNRGIAFGLFQGVGPLVGWFTILVVAGLVVYMVRLPLNERVQRLGLSLIIGGALGNLIDRLLVGQVLDFIETWLRPGVFNVADIMIHLGVIVVIVSSFRPERKTIN